MPGIAMLRHGIFVFPNVEEDEECLDIYHIPPIEPGLLGSIRLVGRLNLPKPASGGNYSVIQCCAAPNPIKDGSFPTYVPSSIPFIDSPENALILFKIMVDSDDSFVEFTMVVHRRALLDLLPPDSELGHEPYFEAAWEEWGPDRTHWFEVGDGAHCKTNVNGQRYVFSDATNTCGSPNVTLLDFNPFNVKRATKVQHKSVLRNPVFDYPLECRLPYTTVLSKEKHSYDGVMINDSAIIAKVYTFTLHLCCKR
ncbi:hypothetical protein AN958_01401 [Leucoagaricus sp. SymC.cos]|nr:hypothetical protein AN958_01401 [Leucoagaricus sp. SymC.cos]